MAAESPAERLRLLILTPFPPRLDAAHGGRMSAWLILRLAERHRVALVCIRGEGEQGADEQLVSRCELVEEVRRRAAPGWLEIRVRQLLKPFWGPPSLVVRTAAPGLGERVRALATTWQPDVIHIELAETAWCLPALDESAAPRVLVDHDPGMSAAEDARSAATGARRWWRSLDVLAWRRYVRRIVDSVDSIVALTDHDRAEVERYARVPVRVIPPATELSETPLDPHGSSPPTVLFFGYYPHPPNADAALRLIRSIVPCVRDRHPDVVLELVGPLPSPEMMAAAGDGVVVTGAVPSVVPHLDRAAVVAAPLRLGGGMRVKVLETLAAGKALVASPRALEGLDLAPGRDVLVAETDEEFCAAISDLVADGERRMQLGASARSWAEANLGWERAVAAYEDLYRELGARVEGGVL